MLLHRRAKKKNRNLKEAAFGIEPRSGVDLEYPLDNGKQKEEKDEDSIQLWRRIAKTEYPGPPDTGHLSYCGQLSDGDLCSDMG